MPETTFPAVDLNQAVAEINNALKEGVYVAVGLGVIGFQRAQVQRVELTKQLEAQWEQLSAQLAKAVPADRSQLPDLSQQLTEAGKVIEEQTSYGLVTEDGLWKIDSSTVHSSQTK